MSRVLDSGAAPASATASISSLAARPAYQSYLMLHIGFAVLPNAAGLFIAFRPRIGAYVATTAV